MAFKYVAKSIFYLTLAMAIPFLTEGVNNILQITLPTSVNIMFQLVALLLALNELFKLVKKIINWL